MRRLRKCTEKKNTIYVMVLENNEICGNCDLNFYVFFFCIFLKNDVFSCSPWCFRIPGDNGNYFMISPILILVLVINSI